MSAIIAAAPIGLALVAALAAIAADAVASPRVALRLAAGILAAAAAFSILAAAGPAVRLGEAFVLGGPRVSLVSAIACALGAIALAGSARLESAPNGGQAAALVAFSTAAGVALIATSDLAVLIVAVEILALAGYALVAAGGNPRAYEAATKYFVQGAVATGLLAYAAAIIFGALGGSLGIGRAIPFTPQPSAVTVALVLLLAALAFKLGAFPFHAWAPDAYETAPPAAAAFLATVPKLAVLIALQSILRTFFAGQAGQWAPLVAVLAVASVAFGNLAALRQMSFRRMLAYSGIAQVGYALVAIAAVRAPLMPLAVFAATYALAGTGAFLAAEAAGEGDGWDGGIAGLAGLARRRPVLAASLAVCLLSLTGIPLTAGFVGKYLVFASAVGSGVTWLAVVGVVGSVVSFGYYGAVLRAVYFDRPTEPAPEASSAVRTWPVALVAVTILVSGILPLFSGLLS